MKMVKNKKNYWDFILSLRNDDEIKKGFIQQNLIPVKSHYEYMEKHGDNYYICLLEDEPVGFIGSVDGDIRLAVSKKHQGKGIGKFMISFIKDIFPAAVAKVKIENERSLKSFQNNGYKIKYYILELQ